MMKSGNAKAIVGYDLGEMCSRISYYSAETKKVETAAGVAGTQIYNIPTVLCKKYGTNQWLYGREALHCAENEEGILVDDLVESALDGEDILVEGEPYDPVGLLALFVKKSLGLLSSVIAFDRIGALMLTCKSLNPEVQSVMEQMLGRVGLKARHICICGYEESFFQYMIHQPRSLREFGTLLFEYEKDRIAVYHMKCNYKTTPRAMVVDRTEYKPEYLKKLPSSVYGVKHYEQEETQEEWEQRDRWFAGLCREVCADERISSVYLVGEGFDTERMKESLQFLCEGRRVFLGSNLYSQGACLGMMEKLRPSEAVKENVLLGTGRLKTNVGIRLLRQGEESYLALLDGGVNWQDAHECCDFYLQDEKSFELVITPLDGRNVQVARMTLDGMQEGAARVHMCVEMESEDRLKVTVEDLGFGEIRPATHRIWEDEMHV